MTAWNGRPRAGERWRYPGTRGYGFVVEHPAETRTVLDRTLGGDVLYRSGDSRKGRGVDKKCTFQEWADWQATAKQEPSKW